MKKLLALAAAITLLCTAALAEFDFYALKDTPDAMTYTVPGTADTVVRPALAPYQGEFGEDELVAYLDYIILPDEEVATFDADEVYNQADSAGFINLFGLPIKVKAKLDQKRNNKQ